MSFFNRYFGLPFSNRHLLHMLIKREIVSRTSGTSLGWLWMLIQPSLQVLAMWFLFSVILKVRYPNVAGGYLGYYLTGMVPWLMLSEVIQRSLTVMSDYSSIYQRSVFPLALLPLLPIFVSGAIYLVIFVTVGFFISGWLGALGAFFVIFMLLFWLIPIAYLLAVFGLFVRDLQQIASFILTMFLYVTPILYMPDAFPARFSWWLVINPFAQLTAIAHSAVQGLPLSFAHFALTVALWLMIIYPARILFLRAQPYMREAL